MKKKRECEEPMVVWLPKHICTHLHICINTHAFIICSCVKIIKIGFFLITSSVRTSWWGDSWMDTQTKLKNRPCTISRAIISLKDYWNLSFSRACQGSAGVAVGGYLQFQKVFCASRVPFSSGLSHKAALALFSEKLDYPSSCLLVWWNAKHTRS